MVKREQEEEEVERNTSREKGMVKLRDFGRGQVEGRRKGQGGQENWPHRIGNLIATRAHVNWLGSVFHGYVSEVLGDVSDVL
jgi:hypothetical protein